VDLVWAGLIVVGVTAIMVAVMLLVPFPISPSID